MKKISVPLTEAGIKEMIQSLDKVQEMLDKRAEQFLDEVAKVASDKASKGFSSATYDGTNDVLVTEENRGEGVRAIVAEGNATLFIEFGTGINYPNDHPMADELGMKRGAYGHRLGRLENGWRYKGEPGSNGQVITTGKHAGEIHTLGNPANRCMYNSQKEAEFEVPEIARRVFND